MNQRESQKMVANIILVAIILINMKLEKKMYLGKKESEKAERNFLEETKYRDLTDYNVMFIDVYNEWLEFKKIK